VFYCLVVAAALLAARQALVPEPEGCDKTQLATERFSGRLDRRGTARFFAPPGRERPGAPGEPGTPFRQFPNQPSFR